MPTPLEHSAHYRLGFAEGGMKNALFSLAIALDPRCDKRTGYIEDAARTLRETLATLQRIDADIERARNASRTVRVEAELGEW